MTTRTTRPGLALFLLAFSQFLTMVDYNIVYVALPHIGTGLDFPSQYLQWVVSAYAVGFGGFLLLGGRMVDYLGAKRIYLTGLVIYAVSSLIGGFAPVSAVLVAARLLQGLGGALLFPAVLALIATSFEEGPQRNKAFAMWGMAGSVGLAGGAILGGVLTSLISWRAVFFVSVVFVAIIMALSPAGIRPDSEQIRAHGFDLKAAVLVTAGVSLIVFALAAGPRMGWTNGIPMTALLVGAVLIALFFLTESRTANPLIPLRLLSNRALAVAMAVLFIFQTGLEGAYYVFTTYVQPVLGYSAMQAGLAFLPVTLASMIGSGKLAPSFMERYGMRITLSAGMIINGLGIGLTAAVMVTDGSFLMLLPGSVIWGIGGGLVFVSVFASAGSGVAPESQGVAAAMASTSQQVGGAVGLAVLVAIANSFFTGSYATAPVADIATGLRTAGLIAAGLLVLGGLAALLLKKDRPEPAVSAPLDAAELREPETAKR